MALLFPQVGENIALAYIVGKSGSTENLVLRLYTSNTTPAATDTAGTYTEASGFGYAAIALAGASWSIVNGNPTQASYAQQAFTFNGALGNVYGYYLTRAISGDLVYAERFSNGPYNVQNDGDQIKVTPQVTAT